MNTIIDLKNSTPAPLTLQFLKRAWKRAGRMSPGEFSHLSQQILEHIGDLYEHRYQLDQENCSDLSAYLSAIMRVCEHRPLHSDDLLTILLTDPRAKFPTLLWDWLMRVQPLCPESISELYEIWSDDRLGQTQRNVITHVLLGNDHLLVKFIDGLDTFPHLSDGFKRWLLTALECKGLTEGR